MSTDPKTIRQDLHTAVDGLLAGNGVESQDIYRYRTSRFRDEAATHVVITTHRIASRPFVISDQLPYYVFRILILARYNDAASEEAAEDALDDLEILLVNGLGEMLPTDTWEDAEFVTGPERTSVSHSGKSYRLAEQHIKLEIN